MLLSIIIPVYNVQSYIRDCLNSIIGSIEELPFEVILIDDGSTDESLQIIKEYESHQIQVFHHENKGVSFTRNRGIRIAKGDYIMFVDADDKLKKGWETVLFKACQSGSDILYFSKRFEKMEVDRDRIIGNIIGFPECYELGNLSSPWSRAFRREFIIDNKLLFDAEISNGEAALFNLCSVALADVFYLCQNRYICTEFTSDQLQENSTKSILNQICVFSSAKKEYYIVLVILKLKEVFQSHLFIVYIFIYE